MRPELLIFDDVEKRIRDRDETLLPGWVIMPSDSATKHPAINAWQTFDRSDVETRERLARAFRHDAWSVLPGPSGLYLVDLDRHDAAKDGVESWTNLLGDAPVSANPRIIGSTPSGGKHLYYSPPGDGYRLGNTAGLVPGVDSRGDGGQALFAGPGRSLLVHEWRLPPLPEAFLDLIALPRRDEYVPWSVADDSVPKSKYGRALASACRTLAATVEGNRNALLNWTAYKPGREALAAGYSLDAVAGELLTAALAAGLPEREAWATIQSGLGVRL